ncbi:MAG: hypothetical protein ACOCZ6_05140 [Nanoarchaeota archaeon]
MKKYSMALMVVGILILLAGCGENDTGNLVSQTANEKISLGYCPTMEDRAEKIADNNDVKLKPYDYTSQALQALNNGQVDVVLVGRLAGKNEVGDVYEKRLKEGLTLAGREKQFIHVNELQQRKVHTTANKELAGKYVPEENLILHNSTQAAINDGIDDLVLINWTDYSDELELVIPVNNAKQKIEKFRIPVLYSYNKEYIESLKMEGIKE